MYMCVCVYVYMYIYEYVSGCAFLRLLPGATLLTQETAIKLEKKNIFKYTCLSVTLKHNSHTFPFIMSIHA